MGIGMGFGETGISLCCRYRRSNPKASAAQCLQAVGLAGRIGLTQARTRFNRAGLRGRRTCTKPLISPQNRLARLTWVRQWRTYNFHQCATLKQGLIVSHFSEMLYSVTKRSGCWWGSGTSGSGDRYPPAAITNTSSTAPRQEVVALWYGVHPHSRLHHSLLQLAWVPPCLVGRGHRYHCWGV